MALRFRRSVKIAPGLKVNFGKRGVSLSAAARGASITAGKNGSYANIGIPGTGISFRSKIGNKSTQKRQELEQRRIEKEYHKLEQEQRRQEALSNVRLDLDKEKGTLQIINSFGDPLTKKDLTLMWQQKRETIISWLEEQADEINGDVGLLTKIHEDTPDPNSISEYQINDFDVTPPAEPKTTPKPVLASPKKVSIFKKVFRKKQLQEINNQLILDHKKEVEEWKNKRKAAYQEYEEKQQSWKANKKSFDLKEIKKKESFLEKIKTDIDFMDEILQESINSLSWPRETIISYQIEKNSNDVWLDVDLPEIEDMPQKIAAVAATGKKLNIKQKSKKQSQLEYAAHIHGIAFRLLGTIFATLPTTKQIIISGYSQRLDSATGRINNDYLYSFKVERGIFANIDFSALESVDPIQALGVFENRRKMTATGIFKPISPFQPVEKEKF